MTCSQVTRISHGGGSGEEKRKSLPGYYCCLFLSDRQPRIASCIAPQAKFQGMYLSSAAALQQFLASAT